MRLRSVLLSKLLLMKIQPAGNSLTVEVLENQFTLVLLMRIRMVYFATLYAEKDTLVSVQFAGKTALLISETMELIVASHPHMEEEPDLLKNVTIVRSTASCGTLFAEIVITTLDVVSVLPTVSTVCTTLEFHARKILTEELRVIP